MSSTAPARRPHIPARRAALLAAAAALVAGCAPRTPAALAPVPAPVPPPPAYARENPAAPATAFVGGRWFDGTRFVARDTVYAERGLFVARRPARVERTVDLSGTYVVPPYGDAHVHHFDGVRITQAMTPQYLREGTFYALSLTNYASGKRAAAALVNRPDGVDVAYADAGGTRSGSHPQTSYEAIRRGLFNKDSLDKYLPELKRARTGENDVYVLVDSLAEVDAKWPRVVASRPDVVKLYLLRSERYDTLRAVPNGGAFDARRDGVRARLEGLDPLVVPPLVARAHAAGLRVAAHVETAHDVDVALRAGVDVLAHLPGYCLGRDEPTAAYEIPDAVARLAGRRGVAVTPTVRQAVEACAGGDSVRLGRVRALFVRNLRRLLAAGVQVAVGSDFYGRTAAREAELLRGLGVWDDAGMLRVWAVTTPAVVFPGRRIARLAPGYEASLLALACDPTARWACTGEIGTRVKQGEVLPTLPAPQR